MAVRLWRTALGVAALAGAALLWRALRPPRAVDELIVFDGARRSCRRGRRDECDVARCSFHNVERIVEHLDAATRSIDLCMYIVSSGPLADAVLRAHERGVVVRAIADHDRSYSNGSKLDEFAEAGVAVKRRQSERHMHHKFVVVDSDARIKALGAGATRPRRLVGFGSLNWTKQGVEGNCEDFYLTSHRPAVDQFQAAFDELWIKIDSLCFRS